MVIALNQVSDCLVIIDLVDDEQHHRVLEQIVVERAEQLGDEQRQEAARAEQMGGAVHQADRGSGQRGGCLASHRARRHPHRHGGLARRRRVIGGAREAAQAPRLALRGSPNVPRLALRRRRDADAAQPADAVAHPRGADPGVPAVEAELVRLCDHLRASTAWSASPIISTAISPARRGRCRGSASSSIRSPTRSWSSR